MGAMYSGPRADNDMGRATPAPDGDQRFKRLSALSAKDAGKIHECDLCAATMKSTASMVVSTAPLKASDSSEGSGVLMMDSRWPFIVIISQSSILTMRFS